MSEQLTVREYAARRGVSHTAVHKAIGAGRLKKSVSKDAQGRYVIDAQLADKEWDKHTDQTRLTPERLAQKKAAPAPAPAAVAPPEPEDDEDEPESDIPDINEARARKALYQAELLRIELETKQGQLVPIEEVKATVASEYTAVRQRVLSIPARLAQELALLDSPGEVRSRLERALTEALNELTADANASDAAAQEEAEPGEEA